MTSILKRLFRKPTNVARQNPPARIRTPQTPVTGPPVVLISLYDGLMNCSLRPLYAALTGAGHLTKVVRFGVTVPYRSELDYSVFQTVKVKFPLARKRATDAEIEELVTRLQELGPLWVGISVIPPQNDIAARITRRIHERLHLPVVWGGAMAINEPEVCLRDADAVCIGEGEEVVVAVTNGLKSATPQLPTIPGLWVRTPDGHVEQTPRRRLLTPEQQEALPMLNFERTEDEILLPKDMLAWYENLDMCDGGKSNSATIVHDILFTRGCLFTCTYCHNSLQIPREKGQGPFYRPVSPEWVVEQCKDARFRLGKKRLLIWDDIFPFQPEWVRRFSELYRREIGLPFSINLHSKVITEEVLDLLVQAGLDSANIGIQSGSERVRRDVLGRVETNDQILANAHIAHPRLSICYDMLIDNPFETANDLRDSLALFLQLPHPYIVDTNTLMYFRHHEITNRALAEGHITEEHILGARPDREYEDVTCTPFLPRTNPGKRALMMLIVASQYAFIPRDDLRRWSEDPELLRDDRLMALKVLQPLYANTRRVMFDYEIKMMRFYTELQGRS